MANAGDLVVASATVDATNNNVGTSTSTSYTTTLSGAGAAVVGAAFVAPPSGRVVISYQCLMQHSGADYCYYSPRVLTGGTIGSGSAVLSVGDDNALIHNGNVARRGGASLSLSGLTGGNAYNVQMWVKTLSGTGTWSRQHLIVIPQV